MNTNPSIKAEPQAKAVKIRDNRKWVASHANGRVFWHGSRSECIRKAGKTGHARPAREDEQ